MCCLRNKFPLPIFLLINKCDEIERVKRSPWLEKIQIDNYVRENQFVFHYFISSLESSSEINRESTLSNQSVDIESPLKDMIRFIFQFKDLKNDILHRSKTTNKNVNSKTGAKESKDNSSSHISTSNESDYKIVDIPERRVEVKLDEIIEESYSKQKNENFLLTDHFYDLIPLQLECKHYYKKQKYEDIINSTFDDVYFPSVNKNISYVDSILKINKLLKKNDIDELGKYKFGKLSKIKNYIKFFDNSSSKAIIKKKDEPITPLPLIDLSVLPSEGKVIKFNNFGNCNLYNCIIFLSMNKDWLHSLIKVLDLERKIFVINLYIQGKPKQILIDENIPINDNIPAFIYLSDQFWILLIEKAFAKINRSYGNIIRSLASEIFPALCGAPLITILHNQNSKYYLWNELYENKYKKWIFFSEFESISLEYYNPENFISYFIINTFQIEQNKYIELSVPENDPIIFQQVKKKFEILKKDDVLQNKDYFPEVKLKSNRLIYIKYDDFFKSFYKTSILKYEPNYHYTFKKFQINMNQYNLVKFKISSTTNLTFTSHLKQNRYFVKVNNYDVPLSRLLIAKSKFTEKCDLDKANMKIPSNESSLEASIPYDEKEISLEFINSSYGKIEKHTVELELSEGIYYVFLKVYSENKFNIVFSIYSDVPLQFEENLEEADRKLINSKNIVNSLNDLFSSYLTAQESHFEIIKEDESMLYSYKLNDPELGFSIIRLENKSKNKILNVSFFYEIYGMNLISHSTKNKNRSSTQIIFSHRSNDSITNYNNISLTVLPLSNQIIIFEWTKNLNEISIYVRPTFKITPIQPVINEKNILTKPKTYITDEIFYYEISYQKGIFIIIINESTSNYMIHLEFEKLINLYICYPNTGHKDLNIILNRCSAKYVDLRTKKNGEEILYKMNYELQEVLKD